MFFFKSLWKFGITGLTHVLTSLIPVTFNRFNLLMPSAQVARWPHIQTIKP